MPPVAQEELSDEQRQMLDSIYGAFVEFGSWPTFQYVSADVWREDQEEPRETYYALSKAALVRPAIKPERPFELREDTAVGVSLQGLMQLGEAKGDLLRFVEVIRYIGGRASNWRPSSPTAAEKLQITSDELAEALGLDSADKTLERQAALIRDHAASIWVGLSGPGESGSWDITVDPERARAYRHVATIQQYLDIESLVHRAHTAQPGITSDSMPPAALLEGAPLPRDVGYNDLEFRVPLDQEPAKSEGDAATANLIDERGENTRVPISNRTIAALAKPFANGGGPSHSTINMIWAEADAEKYLGVGNKLDRVLAGLRTLRNGREPGAELSLLPADHEKLRTVASALASRLVLANEVDEEAVAEALDEPDTAPHRTAAAAKDVGQDRPQRESSRATAPSNELGRESLAADRRKVMLVHGQDELATRAMVDWLRSVGLRPQEWSQLVQLSGEASPFIGKVLESAFAQAQAVVVLFTPDEQVGPREGLIPGRARWRLQARPNVLFEAGMAFAAYPERTVMAVLGNQELPSDLAGRHFVRLGPVQALRDLAGRLEHAGCEVDLSASDWLDVTRFPDRSGIGATPAEQ
jgi:predicted nucleotide-binding protein